MSPDARRFWNWQGTPRKPDSYAHRIVAACMVTVDDALARLSALASDTRRKITGEMEQYNDPDSNP